MRGVSGGVIWQLREIRGEEGGEEGFVLDGGSGCEELGDVQGCGAEDVEQERGVRG